MRPAASSSSNDTVGEDANKSSKDKEKVDSVGQPRTQSKASSIKKQTRAKELKTSLGKKRKQGVKNKSLLSFDDDDED